MRTFAVARFVRIPPRKTQLVLDQIRGKPVADALAILKYTPRTAARLVEKVLRSAVANAEHNHQVRNLEDLRVVQAIADGGPMQKRVQPRAMGRAYTIRHRTSHITVAVSDEVNGLRRPAAPPATRSTTPKERPAPRATAEKTRAPRSPREKNVAPKRAAAVKPQRGRSRSKEKD